MKLINDNLSHKNNSYANNNNNNKNNSNNNNNNNSNNNNNHPVTGGVESCLMGRRGSLALVGNPPRDGVSIKTLVVVQPKIH